ncbi:sugar phosphate isomerase/epimerase family protein [Streptomyces sp. NBC_01465]|uniref:sugar phosphate isomerase/epimerase family protein n=1 Tax=Streptomyces sp. NBC_01465 TaxID=2903878 RepID=UPI002E30821C|nr:sugar phosphate isomerase/epimerase family protein [Streptomyces sp. NBC_01465]
MIRSIATMTLGGTLPEKFDAIAAAGFQTIELAQSDLESFDGPPEDIRKLADTYGIRISVYQPFRDFEGRPRGEFGHHLERAQEMLRTARALGAELLLVCSTVAGDAVGDEDVRVADLRILADVAAEAGIKIGYEALSWGKFAHLYRHAWRIVDQVDRPNFGLVLDTFHSLALDDELSLLDSIPADRIALIQVADAPFMSCDIIQWSRHHRCLPGEGSFDLEGFLRRPMRNGYRGLLSLEVFSDQANTENPAAVAARGFRSLCALEYSTRRTLAATTTPERLAS